MITRRRKFFVSSGNLENSGSFLCHEDVIYSVSDVQLSVSPTPVDMRAHTHSHPSLGTVMYSHDRLRFLHNLFTRTFAPAMQKLQEMALYCQPIVGKA